MSTNSIYADHLEVAVKAATGAAEIIKGFRSEGSFKVSSKSGIHDLVTSADLASEKYIVESILSRFPNHQIITEESFKAGQNFDFGKPTWVIDPLDGTNNFAFGLPLVGICIAFVENFEVKVGVVECPFLNERYHSVRGEGSYLNNQAIFVNNGRDLAGSIINATLPSFSKASEQFIQASMDKFISVYRASFDVRRSCVASLELCWIAKGCYGGYYCRVLYPWDIAAANLIIKEAGGIIGNYSDQVKQQGQLYYGEKVKMWLPEELFCEYYYACTPKIREELLAVIKE